jgi:pSer/pThr/pTyr-binding forkhead associated (FHA) protein/tRNA A-37 threonylcarbamoyl transferase component Bud32
MKAAVLAVHTNGAVLRCELRPDELVTVGRSSACDLQVQDASVSREHCVATFTGGKVCINDLRSTHGLHQDGQRVDRVELAPGESCRLGKALAKFEARGAGPAQADPAPADPAPADPAPADQAAATEPPQRPPAAPATEEMKTAPSAGSARGAEATPARTIGGYRLIEQIGAGGYGTVYRAEQVQLGREVAVKVLKAPEGDPDQRRIEAFLAEARVAAGLSDARLVQVFDVGEDDGTYFLSMELVRGGSLAQRIKRDGPLPWPAALGVLRDVAQALRAAHAAGLVHRDVKPGNVLLTEAGAAKLTDLGLAADDAHAGTIAFMAPEQLRREAVDLRADLYALGCTAYTALTGASRQRRGSSGGFFR